MSLKPRDKQELARIKTSDPTKAETAPGTVSTVIEDAPKRGLAVRLVRGFFQVLLPLVVLAAALGIYSYLKSTKPAARKRPPQEAVFAVRSIPVAFANYQPFLTLYGTTVAGREVELRSLVAGKVERAGAQLLAGGEVKAGDTLIEIDPFDYRIAISEIDAQLAEARAKIAETTASIAVETGNLSSAKEQLAIAAVDLKRAESLGQRGTVSKRTIDDRRLIAVQRRQQVAQSQNNLLVWEARKKQQTATIARLETTLERARKRLVETKLKAPFNAYVTDVGAQVGRMLNVNDRVATLIDRDWIDVRFTLTDRQFGRLRTGGGDFIGRDVEVRWNVGRDPLVYKAKIERIDGRVSAESGGVQVYARIANPRQPVAVRPGIFVEVRVADTTFERVAKVPGEAVYDASTVYAVVDGRLKARKISVIGTSGSDLLIEGEIKAGEKVLVTRLSRPGDGVLVKEAK